MGLPSLAVTLVLVATVFLEQSEGMTDPVMILPKLEALPTHAQAPRSQLGSSRASLTERRSQCRKMLDVWREGHADYAAYKHAKVFFDKLSAGSSAEAGGFEDLDALYRGLSRVGDHWKQSPSGEVYSAASRGCEEDASVSYRIFLPPKADKAAQEEARQKADCAVMRLGSEKLVDGLMRAVRDSLRQVNEDNQVVDRATQFLDQEWTNDKALRSLGTATKHGAVKLLRLQEQAKQLSAQAEQVQDGEERRAVQELSGFVEEQIQWQQREATRLQLEMGLMKQQRSEAQRHRHRAEEALQRRLELNQTVTEKVKPATSKLAAIRRMGVSKGELNAQDKLKMGELLAQAQEVRGREWELFREAERARASEDYSAEMALLEQKSTRLQHKLDRVAQSASLLLSSQRAMRTQLSLLVSDGDRALAYTRLAALTTKAEAARGAQKRALLQKVALQREQAALQARHSELQLQPLNHSQQLDGVLAGLDALEADLKYNTSQYGALESHRALKLLADKRDHLQHQARLRVHEELHREVVLASSQQEVHRLAPGLLQTVQSLEHKLRVMVCTVPTRDQLHAEVEAARVHLDGTLSRVHAELVHAARAKLHWLKRIMRGEQASEQARAAAVHAQKQLDSVETRYNRTEDEHAKARLVRRLAVTRQRANAALLQLRRAEAATVGAKQARAEQALQWQVSTSCRVPQHLSAWNECCKVATKSWLWAQPSHASLENGQQLASAAEQLSSPQDAAVLSEKVSQLQAGWDASGVGIAYAKASAECNKQHSALHEAHAHAEARVERTAEELQRAEAAEKATREEYAAAKTETFSASHSLKAAQAEGASSGQSVTVKQWKFMLAAAKNKERSLLGAVETMASKRIAAEQAAEAATKGLQAAQEGTAWLTKAHQLEARLKRQQQSTLDIRKRTALRQQLMELKDQIFVVTNARKAADLGQGGTSLGVSRAELVSNYVAQFQANRVMAGIQAVLPQLKQMEEQAFDTKAEHAAIADKIEQLQADLEHVRDLHFDAEEHGQDNEAVVKQAASGGVSTGQIMVATHSLLQRRARYMYELLNNTDPTGDADQEKAEAQSKLDHIDSELLRIEAIQRKLGPQTQVQPVDDEEEEPKDKRGVLGSSAQLGEASSATGARSEFQLSVQTASVKAAQMANQLEQQIAGLQAAASSAKSEYQQAQVARDLQAAKTRLSETHQIQRKIQGHADVLHRAAKDELVLRKAQELQRELTSLKHQLTLSTMFLSGRSKAGDSTPNSTSATGGKDFQLDSVAKMLAARRARQASAEATRMAVMLKAVQHAIAAVPASARMRVAAGTTLKKALAMKKILSAQMKTLRDRPVPPSNSTVAFAARKKALAELQRRVNKQTKLAQTAQHAIDSSERALSGQARAEEQHSGGCAKLLDQGSKESCAGLAAEASSRCSELHHSMYEQCCGSIVRGWEWGRSKFQVYQSALLQKEQLPHWKKMGSSQAEQRNQLTKMRAQRAMSDAAKHAWQSSQDRQVSLTAKGLCAAQADKHRAHLKALLVISQAKHVADDADEPLSEHSEHSVPPGTADGSEDLSMQTKEQLHKTVSKSMRALKAQLSSLEEQHRSEIVRVEAAAAFSKTKALMNRVETLRINHFVDEHTLAKDTTQPSGAEQQAEDAGAQELAKRKASFAMEQQKLAVEREMDASERSAAAVDMVAKELFEVKQSPPPRPLAPEVIPPVGYMPHSQKLAFLEAKLHRSYAAFLSDTHRTTLQLDRLYKAAQRRAAMVQRVKAELRLEYSALEGLGDSVVSDVKTKALQMAEALYHVIQQVETAEDDAIQKVQQQKEQKEALAAKLHRAKTMVALATGAAPVFNEKDRAAHARNRKVAALMNKLTEAANGVITTEAKDAFDRVVSRQKDETQPE